MAEGEGAAAPTLLDRMLRPGRSSGRDVMLDVAWLAGLGALFMATGLGLRDPWPADEPRFALVAQDMLRTGDWLIPRVGGDLYADKPPLFFWLIAAATALTGSLRVGFLLPSLLAGLGTLLLTYDLLRRARGREVGLAAAFVLLLTFQFVWQARLAQIDAVLCFLTTLSLYGLLRHHCLGPTRGWYLAGWAAAGLGVITKGVGFLPLLALVPFVLLARRGWPATAKRIGSLGVAGVAAMLVAIGLWFVPMIVATSAGGELLDYRNEILFHQTLTRYSGAWHHAAPVYYYFVEIIPFFWLPLVALVPWLLPRWLAAFREQDTMTATLLSWVAIVALFFTTSSGKRGLYVLPAVPALVMAAGPWLPTLLRAQGPRLLAFALACVFTGFAALAAAYLAFDTDRAAQIYRRFDIEPVLPLVVISVCGAIALAVFRVRDGWLAYAGVLGSILALTGLVVNPRLDPSRSGRTFVERLESASDGVVELAMIGSKEQYLLQLGRPSFNFGHARWQEGEWQREAADAAAWLAQGRSRAVLVDRRVLELCFGGAATTDLGRSHGKHWFLVSGKPDLACAESGDPSRARLYAPPVEALNSAG